MDPSRLRRFLLFTRKLSLPLQSVKLDQRGYALPSLLFLVVILSLLAFAVLTHNYLQKQLALRSVSRVRAEYSSESALARMIATLKSPQRYTERLNDPNRQLDSDDGSLATVRLEQWGCYGLVTSSATYKDAKAERTALLGQRPGASFENALLFANATHQLVLTGTASIKGRIVAGPLGITTGGLVGRPAVKQLPLSADVRKEPAPILPGFSSNAPEQQVEEYHRLLKGDLGGKSNPGQVLSFSSTQPTVIDGGKIPPEVRYVVIRGDVVFTGTIDRRGPPLFILVKGNISFRDSVQLDGLVAIIAEKAIIVPGTAKIDHAILYSATRVELKGPASVSAQILSPLIVLRSGSIASYPSLLVSTSRQVKSSEPSGIFVEGGAVVEGTILSLAPKAGSQNQLVVVQPGALVTGAIYSENLLTLDGTVVGTVMTRDFTFEVAPTTYRGWLRSGKIERQARPMGFLLPVGFKESFQLDVLEWL
jgi:cytoskeletal protein CcmA (bactofilin family)